MHRNVIAVCGCWLYEEKEYSFLSKLNSACQENDYMVAALNFSIDPMLGAIQVGKEVELMELLDGMPCAALIILAELIASSSVLRTIRDTAAKKGIPVFSLERHVDGCVNISMNYQKGFKEMVLHVIEHHGCKRIAMIAGNEGNDFSDLRIQQYREALDENNIPFDPDLLKYGDFWANPAKAATEEFLKLSVRPDAIVCANDSMAIAACDVIKKYGLKIPEDIVVTGFDGIHSGRLNYPPLATVAPDYEREVQLVIEMINSHLQGKPLQTEQNIVVDLKVQPNYSCGCEPSGENTREELVNDLSDAYIDQKTHLVAMNRLMFDAAEKDHLQDIADICDSTINLWQQHFYFAGIYSDLLNSESQEISSRKCLSILNTHNGNKQKTGDYYDPRSEIFPGFHALTKTDSGVNMLMLRLLYTHTQTYGYLAVGFDYPTNRDLRRSEELGMFMSTSINTILNNRKLIWLNSKLRDANRVMEEASSHDYLTGIFNRRGFFDALSKLITEEDNQSKTLTFFSIDMDGLKYINDTFGHTEGDYAIRMMAAAIRNFSARNGICARYGGDEFACALITEEALSLTADTVRERLLSFISKNEDAQTKDYTITASVGSCSSSIQTAKRDIEEIIRAADEEMYADKEKRRRQKSLSNSSFT